jgi:predicted RNase H-like nuclease (RuvC/YqgF family)
MPITLEERVAYLEGKVEEHSKVWSDLKDMMINHDAKMIAFEQRIDRRFEAIDRRFEAIDRRFEAIDRRFEAIDQKFSKYFLWIIGIQVSVLLAVIASMLRG